MQISPLQFDRAFKRFQAIHNRKCGVHLVDFTDRMSYAFKEEGYKNAIPDRAMAVMQPKRWTQAMVGSGSILSDVIRAIELPNNNLLQWQARQGPNSRTHRRLLAALDDLDARRHLDALFHGLYRRRCSDKSTFDAIVAHCGRHYDLLGYLFFIAAPDRFLPLRPRAFDRALGEMGVPLRTEGNCSWENYEAFIATIREVQRRLHREGITNATLLDAHSFCWILARSDEVYLPVPEDAVVEPFRGTLKLAARNKQFTPNDDAAVRDMQKEALKRQASGDIAEEIALKAERNRLRREGRTDLADKVESVANRPGLGHDIQSFNSDGTCRCIEVKNVSNGRRFFVSEGEWRNGRGRSNYWFYLVSRAESHHPRVEIIPASDLKQEHLAPVQYVVQFDPQ